MVVSTILPPAAQRIFQAIGVLWRKTLMAAGLALLLGLLGLHVVHGGVADALKLLLPPAVASVAPEPADIAASGDEAAATATTLTPRMQSALNFVSRRYRVAGEALQPIFVAAQAAGRDLHLDPLLIIAVIGVESGFNPFSQSVYGAQGLMQVVPRFHADKLPDEAAPGAFLDPVTNVRVGASVLREAISRMGGLEDGLQQFGGVANDPARRYASKVLAEKQRLEQAALRLPTV
ncbi:MAG: transglycosylase SLT domain-containing protein [Desulfobulbus sp.]|nr:transglycosylase SLT domain-containing protein [Desulfobulbus sp.]